jgi:hypothetical protein
VVPSATFVVVTLKVTVDPSLSDDVLGIIVYLGTFLPPPKPNELKFPAGDPSLEMKGDIFTSNPHLQIQILDNLMWLMQNQQY